MPTWETARGPSWTGIAHLDSAAVRFSLSHLPELSGERDTSQPARCHHGATRPVSPATRVLGGGCPQSCLVAKSSVSEFLNPTYILSPLGTPPFGRSPAPAAAGSEATNSQMLSERTVSPTASNRAQKRASPTLRSGVDVTCAGARAGRTDCRSHQTRRNPGRHAFSASC